ncbi:hypothetical protein [Hydrotalea sandarakina]|jgi:hypothetical protein|uniref:Outer membrane protein with beta-barrel domain n=1 Tax=Hydrotalea sandarakina TaxID=1004304 RepID=A0A2W7RGS9_9BACT|nr:hypothetical protein [Hydrotalea sandarakina]PZX59391.1 hypothetical protein LX80_02868 [Hydrotalea sandarakina]
MKFYLSCLLLLLSSSLAHAQLEQGTWLVGGAFSFSTDESRTPYPNSTIISVYRNTNFKINPSIGYFLFDKLAAGIKPQFTWYKATPIENSSGTANYTRFWIGPFIRYYLLKPDRQWNFLTEANYQYEITFNKPDKVGSNNYSFNAGPVIYLNSSVGIEFLMGYYYLTYGAGKQFNEFRGIQLNIGLQIHLTK